MFFSGFQGHFDTRGMKHVHISIKHKYRHLECIDQCSLVQILASGIRSIIVLLQLVSFTYHFIFFITYFYYMYIGVLPALSV